MLGTLKRWLQLFLLTAGFLCLSRWDAAGFETTYWVWHRTEPLAIEEAKVLYAQGVRHVYWHAGELRAVDGAWRESQPFALPHPVWGRPVNVVPTLRLAPSDAPSLDAAAAEIVGRALAHLAKLAAATEVQLDFDCPDRRLGEYADFLAKIRAQLAPTRLSATALGGWSRLPEFEKLQSSVDSLFPMFYDLEPDAPGKYQPLAHPDLAAQMAGWRKCRIPWHAGLPNFARISVFEEGGESRGQLRRWTWDEVCFNPDLKFVGEPSPGVTIMEAATATTLADTPLKPGHTVAVRLPDRLALAAGIEAAREAGAAGVAIFRLPGEGPQGGWSLPQMGTLLERKVEEPRFTCRWTVNGLELTNVSDTDLPPRLTGLTDARDRGWELELEWKNGPSDVFREAGPGEFAMVFGHKDPNAAVPRRVPIPMAERLTFWFADLRAGQSRRSGLLQVPEAFRKDLRWRMPGTAHHSDWQPLTE